MYRLCLAFKTAVVLVVSWHMFVFCFQDLAWTGRVIFSKGIVMGIDH